MSATLIVGIGELVTNDAGLGSASDTADVRALGIVRGAAMLVEDGVVTWVGTAADAPAGADARLDFGGRAVVPGFVDSHTHLVFDGDRAGEFTARMAGEPYTGGGIATTVAATRAASDTRLRATARALAREMAGSGTTTIEIKSGYGLDVETEARLLRLAGELTDETTFLGAHVVPPEFAGKRDAYVELVCGEMLTACAPLARWIDVFCDTGAFDADETRRVLSAGVAAGLMPRLHGNQLGDGPGVAIAVEFDAASVDHCTHLTDADVEALAASTTVATLLPGAEFGTRSPYPDARRLLEAGVTVALATDCNPGTSFVTSMPLMIALAVRDMRMMPAQALLAATAGGAKALRRDDIGRLNPGARADFAVLDAPSYTHIAYRPGSPLVTETWRAGVRIAARGW
ncbi:MAG: imidazolonepropionase [Coriobacteriia bacterium]|nr:imidazolonepropionase [Coriobacteriia bacterium]